MFVKLMDKTYLILSEAKWNLVRRLRKGSSFIHKAGRADAHTKLFGQPLGKVCPDDCSLPKPVTVSLHACRPATTLTASAHGTETQVSLLSVSDRLTPPVPSPGDAAAAEEAGAIHGGSVPETLQQQEHAGRPREAQQRPGGGPGGAACRSAGRPAQGSTATL